MPCEFPDVLALALLLKTIPRSQATSKRTGRQLRDLEGVGRARLLAVRGARAILIWECGPLLAEAEPLINRAVRQWATARVRRPYRTPTDAKRRQFQTVDSDTEDVSSSSDSDTSGCSTGTYSRSSDGSQSSDSSENISEDNSDAPSEAEQHATTIAATLVQETSQSLPVAEAPTTPQEAPPPVDQLWDWFWAAAPTSIRQYGSKLHSDGFDNVRAITLLRLEDLQRYDMPFGHRAQLVHHAKEALGLK